MAELSDHYTAGLHLAQRNVTRAERELYNLVVEIRRAGYPYAAIGAALGVSRQAAWERFSGYVKEQLAEDEEA